MACRRINAVEFNCGLMEKQPEEIQHYIFSKLEAETVTTLCSVACVSRTLNSSVKSFRFPSVDFSAFCLNPKEFPSNDWKIKKITFDCLRLNDSAIQPFLGSHVEELVLLRCTSLSFAILNYIGTSCPHLRVLTLEFSGLMYNSVTFEPSLRHLLKSCRCIEVLCIRVCGKEMSINRLIFGGIYELLPKTIKVLKLELVGASDTVVFLKSLYASVAPVRFGKALTHLSLVVDIITNALLLNISQALPLLTKLNLEDCPSSEPSAAEDDLSDLGIQYLINCKHLTSLSLRRRQINRYGFKFVTDSGMFCLVDGCKGLEYVRLAGFHMISDAGFARILTSCLNLKKFVIQRCYSLTDMAFEDLTNVRKSLVEVKLVECHSVSSQAVYELGTCSEMKVLDLRLCFFVGDSCLINISCLASLTTLNLSNTEVTDAGMAILGKGNTPISCLSLRGCRMVTDVGIALLLASEGKIVRTLSSLDIGDLPKVTDKAITIIVKSCVGLTELCIRYCEQVTDASVMALAIKGTQVENESKLLRRLDLRHCKGLSVGLSELLKKPLFPGLQWIGIEDTSLEATDIVRGRRWLTVCQIGCEMGCRQGWEFH